METIKTLYRIDLFNRKTCQTETIKQIAELHPITIVSQEVEIYGDDIDK